METEGKKILLLLPEGTTIRNFLTTDIIKHLLSESDAEIICAVSDPERYSSLFVDPRVSYIQFYKRSSFSIISILLLMLRSRFLSINENISLEIFRKSLPYYKIERFLRFPFPKSKIIFNLLNKLQDILYVPLKETKDQVELISPDLIVSTHLIKRDEYDYLMYAKSKGLATIGMVKSFDNVTGKGYFVFRPDSIIVWNKVMEQELIDLYSYKKENISINTIQFTILAPIFNFCEHLFLNHAQNGDPGVVSQEVGSGILIHKERHRNQKRNHKLHTQNAKNLADKATAHGFVKGVGAQHGGAHGLTLVLRAVHGCSIVVRGIDTLYFTLTNFTMYDLNLTHNRRVQHANLVSIDHLGNLPKIIRT